MKYIVFSLLACIMQLSCKSQVSNNITQPTVTESAVEQFIFKDVDVAAAQNLISENPKLVIIDVRTPGEIANGKIDGALEIDFKNQAFKDRISELDKSQPYLVYCHAGGRSSNTLKLMQELGFQQVYNLSTGYSGWPSKKN